MRRYFCLLLLAVPLLFTRPGRPNETSGVSFFRLPAPSGFVILPDGVTLLVSQAKDAKLIYFDTVEDKELKQVEVDFKPGALAVQGKTLFAAAQGGAIVYALDPMSGKVKKEYPYSGDAVAQLACHPTKGLLYVTTTSRQVFAIDPASGAATKTVAMGDFIVVDPVDGSSVFTGIKPPPDEHEFIIKTDDKGNFRIIWDRWGVHGASSSTASSART